MPSPEVRANPCVDRGVASGVAATNSSLTVKALWRMESVWRARSSYDCPLDACLLIATGMLAFSGGLGCDRVV